MIYFMERNVHGAWVVYGINGIQQFYERAIERVVTLYKLDEQSVVYKHKVMYWVKER